MLLNFVSAVAIRPNGNVVIGGGFDNIDGAPAEGLAEWDGTIWRATG